MSKTKEKIHSRAILDFIDSRRVKTEFLETPRLSPHNGCTELTINNLQKNTPKDFTAIPFQSPDNCKHFVYNFPSKNKEA